VEPKIPRKIGRMKLSSIFLAATANATCFEKDVDIDGNFMRSNVVRDILAPTYSPTECQRHCHQWRSRGCEYFVWEEMESSCTLYTDIEHIEHDEDTSEKMMGPVAGCLQCFRHGWDYVSVGSGNNMQGYGYIESVPNVYSCARICTFVDECEHVSYHKAKQRCFLKNRSAPKGVEYDDDYTTATIGCTHPSCIKENTQYENGYFSRYDIIGKGAFEAIPGVSTPAKCQEICRRTTECVNFTWQDGNKCYLVNSPSALEYDDDKVSGSRDCK